jgi:glutathione S-transferase
MRARMAIIRTGFQVEHREVILRDRPQHMLDISPKGTVPVMLLDDGTVIEESIEIMEYVQSWNLSSEERGWMERNDDEFKFHLDRYKYPNRYHDVDKIEHRSAASNFIRDLDSNIPEGNLSDAIFPFIRQFANHDRDWFDSQEWNNVHEWLEENLSSDEFKTCMTKYPQWSP